MSFEIKECLKITKFITFFEAIRESDYAFPGESHDFWECVYVKNGYVCASSDDSVYNLKKGDIIFHHPLAFHKFHVEQNHPAELFIFSFTMEGKYADFFKNKVFTLNINQKKIIQSALDFANEKLPERYDYFDGRKILRTLENNDVHIAILANYIYSLFLSLYDVHDITTETDSESARIFKQAVNYMNNNPDSKLTIKSLSEKCCTNTTALKKIFLEYAGCGVHKYFLTLKINKAITLMSSGHSVSEIAEILGFSSQAYFSAAFKRETGISPTDYKHKTI